MCGSLHCIDLSVHSHTWHLPICITEAELSSALHVTVQALWSSLHGNQVKSHEIKCNVIRCRAETISLSQLDEKKSEQFRYVINFLGVFVKRKDKHSLFWASPMWQFIHNQFYINNCVHAEEYTQCSLSEKKIKYLSKANTVMEKRKSILKDAFIGHTVWRKNKEKRVPTILFM